MRKSLSALLKLVDSAFCLSYVPADTTFVYQIGPIYGKWRFHVVDNWHAWIDKEYEIYFDADSPEECVQYFLDYIYFHKINPYKLRHEVQRHQQRAPRRTKKNVKKNGMASRSRR